MSEQLLTILKFALLALLYLFFLRVLRAVWAEIRGPRISTRRQQAAAVATASPTSLSGMRVASAERRVPRQSAREGACGGSSAKWSMPRPERERA